MKNNKKDYSKYPSFSDYRLTKLILQDPTRCSTISEYSKATSMPAELLLEELYPYTNDSSISFEAIEGEIFLNTSPHMRACEHQHFYFAENLWEILRQNNNIEKSNKIFNIFRALEMNGWRVEFRAKNIPIDFMGNHTELALKVGKSILPLLLFPKPSSLDKKDSPLLNYGKTKLPVLAIIINEGALDLSLSYIRKWFVENSIYKNLDILLLEAPTHAPYILSGSDGSLQARSATLSYLENFNL